MQPQEPAYQPYTNPYTGNPFNEAYPIGNLTPQSSPSYQWPPGGYNYPSDLQSMTPEQQYQWSQLNGIPLPSFNDRSGPPQLPDVINNGGYPTLDQRWSPLNEPYYNQPLNDALWQRGSGAQSGPQVEPNRFTPPPELPLPPDSEIWTPVPGSWQEKLLGPGPRTSAGPLNSMAQMPQRDAIAQAVVEQPPSMADFQSPANNYDTFQKGPTYDWQSSIPAGRNDPRVINEVLKSAGETGLPPAVIAAILNMESVWNPGNKTGGQYGLAQMSENMWADNPFNGRMGDVDFATYRDDPVGDKQIRAYTDWLIRGNKLNRDGIDVASITDPVMQAAVLQAIQFAGNSSGWRNALAQGNMDTYVTTEHPQAEALRPGGEAYPTINSMYNAYDKILGSLRK